MLPLRSLVRIRQCTSCATTIPLLHKKYLSTSRQLLQDQPKRQSTVFVPAASTATRTPFKDSPISQSADRQVYDAGVNKVSIDNYPKYEALVLPQTGKYSGRTVRCKPGNMKIALGRLRIITRENKVKEEALKARVRYKPSDARHRLRSQRHRIRFKQGVRRLAEIVLQMRRKSF